MRGYQIPGASAEESELEGEEAGEKTSALWEVMFEVQAGDVIVVDGRGDLATGCFGEMLMTYFQAQGGGWCRHRRWHSGFCTNLSRTEGAGVVNGCDYRRGGAPEPLSC